MVIRDKTIKRTLTFFLEEAQTNKNHNLPAIKQLLALTCLRKSPYLYLDRKTVVKSVVYNTMEDGTPYTICHLVDDSEFKSYLQNEYINSILEWSIYFTNKAEKCTHLETKSNYIFYSDLLLLAASEELNTLTFEYQKRKLWFLQWLN